ncbi:EF-hand calcium-binding domain-containing protein 14 isoform X2 [Rhipicephalus sanguineus]|uniref:EF-hand calcium-binding domain-containing protein 14 isoform X2 n=1 Tax=Rhipicephalus sanguineus TaxID=34632 RepID=UPI0018939377|nr:EF-hand calcium-binding domain-containing protein 14 isoform X2 [Rhipicephalus sanguineus]
MKKRKELDALVSCRSTAPRAVLSSSQQQHAVQELLRKGAVVAAAGSHGGGHGSDSSDDVETSSYAALAAYRLPAAPPVRWWAWLPVGLVLLVGAAGALVWLHLTLRQDLDSLRAHLHRVDVDGKKLPAQLHDLHAQIKGLEQNLSSTATELHRTAADLVALAKQVADLKATTGSLQESVASAPQIKGLPSAVTDLKQNVANLGSQVSSLDNGLQALKEQHNSLQVLRKDIDQVKEQVQRISNASAVAVDDQSSTHTSLHDLEQSVQQCLGEVRNVVDQRLVGLESGLKEVHTTTENHTDILLRQQTQLEGVLNCTHTCPADLSPENLSLALDRLLSPNATVNGSTVVDVLKEAGHLGTVYHGLQAQLGVNRSASDEVAELLQRATLYTHMPPPRHDPQPTATPVQSGVTKQLNSSEGDTGQRVVTPVQTNSTTKRP